MSYFEHYYNPKGEKTLRSYSRPVSLRRFDRMNWMTAGTRRLGDSQSPLRHPPLQDPEARHGTRPGPDGSSGCIRPDAWAAPEIMLQRVAESLLRHSNNTTPAATLTLSDATLPGHRNPHQKIAFLGHVFVQALALRRPARSPWA